MPAATTVTQPGVLPWKSNVVQDWQIPSPTYEEMAIVTQREVQDDRANNRSYYVMRFHKHLGTCKNNEDMRYRVCTSEGGYVEKPLNEVRANWVLGTQPFIPLDPTMQAYFFSMDHQAQETCHPSQIRLEVRDVLTRFPTKELSSRAKELADAILAAALSDMSYSRSIAVFVHELAHSLQPKSKRVLKRCLIEQLWKDFSDWWGDKYCTDYPTDIPYGFQQTGLDIPLNAPEKPFAKERWHMLRLTAFIGDLFATGVIPCSVVQEAADKLVSEPRSLLHLRALHLLFSRCVYTTGHRLSGEYLVQKLHELALNLNYHLLWSNDKCILLWRLEIEILVLRILDQIAQDTRIPSDCQEGQAVRLQWSRSLSPDKVFICIKNWLAILPSERANKRILPL